MNDRGNPPTLAARPNYWWPWFVLGAVLLGILLAVLWMSKEIERTRQMREFSAPSSQTHQNTLPTPNR